MAEVLPAALKIPEVSRFINRANQLRSVKPAIAYWCDYHAVNQIVGKGLHTTDDDCFNFTKLLIERLEATKAERADDDAVVDNDAGQAYVEQFAQETFGRAERTLRANKVTRQTADTFDAAATFFDLTREWAPPDAETVQKIKFAKWNAARILKAIREGKDPNESNPNPLPPAAQEDLADRQPALSLDDPSVQQILGQGPPPPPPQQQQQQQQQPPRLTVEDEPESNASASHFHHGGMNMPPPAGPSAPPPDPSVTTTPATAPNTAWAPPPPPTSQPTSTAQNASSNLDESPASFYSRAEPPAQPSPSLWAPSGAAPSVPAAAAAAPAAAPPIAAATPALSAVNYTNINQAQKHAKWAISALNFEDVPTAVKELRNALSMLGAQQ